MSDENALALRGTDELTVISERTAAIREIEIKAAYTMAIARPRDLASCTTEMLSLCDDFEFASTSKYRIPYKDWKKKRKVFISGLNKNFSQAAMYVLGHFSVDCEILDETEDDIRIRVWVVDCQRNNRQKADGLISKYREYTDNDGNVRKTPLNQQAYRAAYNAERSKLERDCILKLAPPTLKRQAEARITEVMQAKAYPLRRKALGRFLHYGANPGSISRYFGIDIERQADIETQLDQIADNMTPAQAVELFEIGCSIGDGIATWNDFSSGTSDTIKAFDPSAFSTATPIPRDASSEGENSPNGPVDASGRPAGEDQTPEPPSAKASAEGSPSSTMDLRAEWDAFLSTLKTADDRTQEWNLVKKTFHITRLDQISGLPSAFMDHINGRKAAYEERG